ncbi:MAG: hypothetical protein QM487_03000 [Candidatus Marithrix sp.]
MKITPGTRISTVGALLSPHHVLDNAYDEQAMTEIGANVIFLPPHLN